MSRPKRSSAPRLRDRSSKERAAGDRAFHATRLGRTEGLTLRPAARRADSTPETVLRYLPNAWEKRGGRWRTTEADTYEREQITVVIGPRGEPTKALVATRSSRQASVIGEHNADLSILLSVRSAPTARAEARSRIEARHGKRAGLTATLADGLVIRNPQFYGDAQEIVGQSMDLDLGDIDYGSSASVDALR